MATITYTEKLTTVTCTCGINFAIPDTLNQQALDNPGPAGRNVYCPLGHCWHYTGKTEAQKLAERLERRAGMVGHVDVPARPREGEPRGDERAAHQDAEAGRERGVPHAATGRSCSSPGTMTTKHPDFASPQPV